MNNPVLAQQEEFSDYFEKIGSSVNNVVSTTDNEVGIGESLKEAVLSIDKVTLFRYLPIDGVKPANKKPLLIAYSLIGSYKMLDLQQDRSVIKNLLLKGIEVYVIDWGHPNKSDKWLSFDDVSPGFTFNRGKEACNKSKNYIMSLKASRFTKFEKKAPKSSLKKINSDVNCNSPVWEKRPICN